ncbi:MAG: LPXTG cell wall anchor domain-containing protein [Streptococcus orisratti]|uniref:LPXTG cell wall anchor domain-containing protein n=1 Tax=Streptococcus orisratti TaxID=114652 RepID=UPI0023539B31|nr:LPXTG cell wall anchor domain-containing protein [Streptococcus orisratti]MCI7677140.1 LPXTG cell wall anchor domain-containing protein [Streptococcus orisratti]MDY5635902.1 LPXTG cell wall anchor domain-containing protein [Streptococcus orisratti]
MKKFIKLGVVFASVTILSGVVAPVGGGLLNTNSVAYAQENDTRNIYVEAYHDGGILQHYSEDIPVGQPKQYVVPEFEGYKIYSSEIVDPVDYSIKVNGESILYIQGVDSVALPAGWSTRRSADVLFYYKPVDTPSSNPEQPVQQPKTLNVSWVSIDGDLSNTTLKEEVITVNPGESHTVSALDFPGYRLTDGSKAGTYTYETMGNKTHVGIWYTRDHSTPTPEPTPDPTVTEEPTTAPTSTTEALQTETSSTESSATSSSSSASTTSGKSDSTSIASTTARTEVTEAKTEAPTTQKEEKKTLPKTGEEAQVLLSLTGIGMLVASLLAWKERRNH